MLFWAIFHCGNGIRQRIDYYPENIINHNFVRYPNSMVWKLGVYVKITVTYFYKPNPGKISIFVTFFDEKLNFGLYFTLWPINRNRES